MRAAVRASRFAQRSIGTAFLIKALATLPESTLWIDNRSAALISWGSSYQKMATFFPTLTIQEIVSSIDRVPISLFHWKIRMMQIYPISTIYGVLDFSQDISHFKTIQFDWWNHNHVAHIITTSNSLSSIQFTPKQGYHWLELKSKSENFSNLRETSFLCPSRNDVACLMPNMIGWPLFPNATRAFTGPMHSNYICLVLIQSVLQNLPTLANHIGKIIRYMRMCGCIIVYKIRSWKRSPLPCWASKQLRVGPPKRKSAESLPAASRRVCAQCWHLQQLIAYVTFRLKHRLISCFDIKHEETRYNKRTSILQTVEDHIPWLTSWMFTTGLTTTKRKRGALGISIHHGEWNSVWCRPGRVTSQVTQYTCCAANGCNPAFEHSNEFKTAPKSPKYHVSVHHMCISIIFYLAFIGSSII